MNKLTITALLCYLRNQLLDARERRNIEQLQALDITLGIIEEAAIDVGDNRLYGDIVMNLVTSAQDALNDEEWKSTIPSIEEIEKALR